MPTFIDESGDTGSVASGGKPYFRLAAVWVPTLDDADGFRKKIRTIRPQLTLKSTYEFRYANTCQSSYRDAFFAAAMSQEFRFAIGVVDKTDKSWCCATGSAIHWGCAVEVAALLRPVYCQAEETRGRHFKEQVVVDDNSDSEYLAILKQQFGGLRKGLPLVGKVMFRNSKSDEMLQLADMVCGAVGDEDDRRWYDRIADRHLL